MGRRSLWDRVEKVYHQFIQRGINLLGNFEEMWRDCRRFLFLRVAKDYDDALQGHILLPDRKKWYRRRI